MQTAVDKVAALSACRCNAPPPADLPIALVRCACAHRTNDVCAVRAGCRAHAAHTVSRDASMLPHIAVRRGSSTKSKQVTLHFLVKKTYSYGKLVHSGVVW